MSREFITTVTDDIDGSADATTVRFHIDRTAYEIDLSDENAAKLREALAPFIAAARKAGTERNRTGGAILRSVGGQAVRTTGKRPGDTAEKRTFLRANGHPNLSDRGRFSREQDEAWTAELARRADAGATTPEEPSEAVSEAVSAPAGSVRTKVGKLTPSNVSALREVGLLGAGSGNTFAILDGNRDAALEAVSTVMAAMPTKRGNTNYASLVAVRLKLTKNNEKFVSEISGENLPAASSE